MQVLSLLKLVSVSCSFFFFSMSKSSIPWIMPLEFYHSFCIVWIPLQHKHLVLTLFVYYPISVDNQRTASTLYKLVQYSNLLQYSIWVPYGELSTPSVLWFRALEIENV